MSSDMLETIKALGVISRAEFLLPNLGSLIMGLAWGATPSISIGDLVVLIILSFSVINLSSAIGAQANTLSDRELDSMDERKKHLVKATNSFGVSRLKRILAVEFVLNTILVFLFILTENTLFH